MPPGRVRVRPVGGVPSINGRMCCRTRSTDGLAGDVPHHRSIAHQKHNTEVAQLVVFAGISGDPLVGVSRFVSRGGAAFKIVISVLQSPVPVEKIIVLQFTRRFFNRKGFNAKDAKENEVHEETLLQKVRHAQNLPVPEKTILPSGSPCCAKSAAKAG